MKCKKFSNINDIQYVQKSNGLRKSLGSGSFGQVRLVTHKNDPQKKYAMKKIQNTNLTEMKIIFQEIQLHQNLNHPNIIKFEEYLESGKEVFLFLEYAENGDLFGYINKHKLQEKELLRLFYQSCLAIQYLHSRNIMHRDLKPENILVDKDINIKVCDFGWSTIYRENEIRETVCGTLEYMAPEIFMKKRQTKKTDVWALGILLFELFHNKAPFRGMRADIILRQIRANKIMYKNNLNPQIKELIEKILNTNPLMRPSIDQILKSSLFNQFKYQQNTVQKQQIQKQYSVNQISRNKSQYSTQWVDSGFKQKIKPKNNVQIRYKSGRKNSHTTQDTKNNYMTQDSKTRPVSRRKIVINNSKRDYSAQVQSQRIIQVNSKKNFNDSYQMNKQFNSNGFSNYKKYPKNKKQKNNGPALNKSYARRDRLLEIEQQAKQIWNDKKLFEREIDNTKPKFLITFPYPYMNGKIHLGHAYSMSKVEFMTRYKILKGFNVLFPQGYHCTGMPISAAAKKLTEEIAKYNLDNLKILASKRKEYKELLKQNKSDKEPEFDFDFSTYPFMTQYEILLSCQIKEEDIPKFQDSLYWLEYFPSIAQNDLKNFGLAIDHRRSFITTCKNPYYNSFIEWQFNILKERDAIKFGKRPSIYSPKDGQMCADHDRAEGEHSVPQEYTLIKIKVTDTKSKDVFKVDEPVYLVAATLRPETMYGQTNCFVLPDGNYGIYKMENGEVWVCSDKSMRNMSYQYMTKEYGQVNKLGDVLGMDIIGLECKAPLSVYEKIYVWPMLSISMNKGTGVVTSVPSDAPDDYAVLKDLQNKKAFREKYGLTDEQVVTYSPVSIIEVPDYSDLSAVTAYEAFKIKSQNDKEKLTKAKEEVYLKGFYKGIMKMGDFKGKSVKDAKDLVKQQLIDSKQGVKYFEPDQLVISRTGEECVVALCDQWYINYGQDKDREVLKEFVSSQKFEKFNNNLENAFLDALDWLKEWGCSRSFGLGSRLPWDKQYLIESLSDSTIYMSYYSIAHYLQKDLQGKEPGLLGIKAEDITHDDWNYIFLNKERNSESKISEENLKTLRQNFEYWYPMDLRCSGKDLIKNHLIMSLYNHKFVWGDKYLPQGIFCNGWVMVNGEKMSKSKGNFFTLEDFGKTYSNDASRIAFANAGDTLDNANIELQQADQEQVFTELTNMYENSRVESTPELEFYDQVFENQIKQIIYKSDQNYSKLIMREVVKEVFYNMNSIRDEYVIKCGNLGMKKSLIRLWMESQLLILYPITPHFCDIMWKNLFVQKIADKDEKLPELVSLAAYPDIKEDQIDKIVLKKNDFVENLGKNLRTTHQKSTKKKKKQQISKIYFLCAENFQDWQKNVMNLLMEKVNSGVDVATDKSWTKELKEKLKGDKKVMKKAMAFASFKIKEYNTIGNEALSGNIMFKEKDLIQQNLNVICKGVIDPKQIQVVYTSEVNDENYKNLQKSVDHSVPENPIIIIEF